MAEKYLEDVPIGDLVLGGVTYPNCVARFGRYALGNLAIVIDDAQGERVCVATVNVPGVQGLFIKDYSENSGLLDQLVSKGLVRPTGVIHISGYVELPEVLLAGAFYEAASPWVSSTPATRGDVKEVLRGVHYGIGSHSIADSLKGQDNATES